MRIGIGIALTTALFALGCEVVPAGNPYDPESPLEVQADGRIIGRLILPELDLETQRVQLNLRDRAGDLVLADGAPREYPTRIEGEALPDGLDGDVPVGGTFEIEVKPGVWQVDFDPALNGIARYAPASVRGIEVLPGGTSVVTLRPAEIDDSTFEGAVQGSVEGAIAGRPFELRLIPDDESLPTQLLSIDGAETFTFRGLAPNATYQVRAAGEGYAPAASEAFTIEEQHTQSSPLVLGEPLRLTAIGDVFDVVYPAGSEAPYLPEARADLQVAPLVTLEDVRFEARAAVAPLDQGTGAPLDPASGLPAGFDDAWQELTATGLVLDIDLDDTLPDGPRAIVAQLRACFDEACTDGASSRIMRLDVVVDRAAPRALSVAIAGEASSADAGGFGIGCLRFGAACPPPADANPYAALLELDLLDEVGAVRSWAATLDDDAEPTTLTPVDASPGIASVAGDAPAISADEEGEHVLRVWARDRAGNVGLVHERTLDVDLTPVALGAPSVVLVGTETLDDGGSDIEILPGELVSVDVNAGTIEDVARWRVARSDGPILAPNADAFVSYSGPTTALLSGAHRDDVTLRVEVEDAAGNVTVGVPAFLKLWRAGWVTATVTREDGGNPDALTAQLTNAAGDVIAGTLTTGALAFDEVPTGRYDLTISGDGLAPLSVPGIEVTSARTTALGALQVLLPRGSLSGRFILEDAGEGGNAGIQVSLVDAANRAIAGAATLADGSYRFADVPAGTGYRVIASFDGYVSVEEPGVSVVGSTETVIRDDGTGEPEPLALTRFEGDFTLCAPTGVLQLDCAPLIATNLQTVEVGGIDLSDVTEYRISLAPFPDATTGWTALTLSGSDIVPPSVTFPANDERRHTVYLQLRQNLDTGDVLTVDVVFDQTPPEAVALELFAGEDALLDGFTNEDNVDVRVSASAGAGEVAGLGVAVIAFATSEPGSIPAQTQCPHGVTCAVPLDTLEERTHTAYAWSCDVAGNCSPAAVSANIVYDVTPPTDAGTGVSAAPVVASAAQDDGTRIHMPVRDHEIDIAAGTAADPGPDGQPAPEAVGARVSLDTVSLDNRPLVSLAPTPDAVTSVSAPSYTGAAGADYDVYVQLVDAAGNVSSSPLSYTVRYDPLPPRIGVDVPPFVSECDGTTDVVIDDLDGNDLTQVTTYTQLDTLDDYALPTPGAQVTRSVSLAPALGACPDNIDPSRPDGAYVVTVQATDRAGNVALVSQTVLVDRVAPAIVAVACPDCQVSGGVAYTQSTAVAVEVNATDATSGYVGSSVVVNGGTESGLAPSGLLLAFALDAVVTPQTVEVYAYDGAGNRSAPFVQTMRIDAQPPTATLVINANAQFTSELDVVLAVAGSDAQSAVSGLRIANDTCSFTGSPAPFTGGPQQIPWTLSSGSDGTRTVCVEITDIAGNVQTEIANIELDRDPPGGSITVASGAAKTSSTSVAASGTFDEPVRVAVGDGLDCSSASFGASFVTSLSGNVTLSATEGSHTVVACLQDRAGNTASLTADIELDRTSPLASSVTILGTGYTNSTSVQVRVEGAAADASEMALLQGASPDCRDGTYGPIAPISPFTLAGTAGTKTVSLCLRDDVGNVGVAGSDTVVYDDVLPTAASALAVNTRGSSFATTGSGTVVPPGGTTNDPLPVFSWTAGSDALSGPVTYTLELYDDAALTRLVYAVPGLTTTSAPAPGDLSDDSWFWRVRTVDLAGNSRVSTPSGFTVDRTPPDQPLLLPIPPYANNDVTIDWVLGDPDAVEFRVTLSIGMSQVVQKVVSGNSYTFDYPTEIPASGGTQYNVRVEALDLVGNRSSPAVGGFTFDNSAPCEVSRSLQITGGAYTSQSSVTAVVNCNGETPTQMQVDCDGTSPQSKPTVSYAQSFVCALNTSTQGTKRVDIQVRDAAGNVQTFTSDSVIYDSVEPSPPTVSPGNAIDANYQCAKLDVPAGGAVDTNFQTYQMRSNGGAWVDVTPSSGKIQFDLLQDTANLLEVRAVDRAGNVGQPAVSYVEEVSSVLVPTRLEVEAVCGNGTFAILRDPEAWPAATGYPDLGDVHKEIGPVTFPEFALLDIVDVAVYPFSGDGGIAQLNASAEALLATPEPYENVLAMGCSPDDTKVLFAYAKPLASPNFENGHHTYTVVWNDPIDNLYNSYTPRGPWYRDQDGARVGYAPASFDQIDWLDSGSDHWLALAVDHYIAGFLPAEVIRRVRYNGSLLVNDWVEGQINGFGARRYWGLAFTTGTERNIVMEKSGTTWSVLRSIEFTNNSGTLLDNLTYSESPWGRFVKRSSVDHRGGVALHQQFIASRSNGAIESFGSNSTVGSVEASGGYANAFFVQRNTNRVSWLHETQSDTFELRDSYVANLDNVLESQKQRYGPTPDTDKPMFGTSLDGAGDAVVLYHTTSGGSAQGVVIGYKDQTGCLND